MPLDWGLQGLFVCGLDQAPRQLLHAILERRAHVYHGPCYKIIRVLYQTSLLAIGRPLHQLTSCKYWFILRQYSTDQNCWNAAI